MKFSKYHGLGNDYIVLSPLEMRGEPDPDLIRLICNRNFGVGSDGVLLGPFESECCDFGLRIFNPDGSEAEKSGNGLRIFARFLWDSRLVDERLFSVETPGGAVSCEVSDAGREVSVCMGRVSLDDRFLIAEGAQRGLQKRELEIDGSTLTYCTANVGNPHCVVFSDDPTPEQAQRLGPVIEAHPRFPNRTNVQFMRVLSRRSIQIEIWERGAGYTLASGSSSVAAAAVAHTLGLCDPDITVQMPGGRLHVQFNGDLFATLTGPVMKVCDGTMADELLR
jgi:diaminopimelate epimerase